MKRDNNQLVLCRWSYLGKMIFWNVSIVTVLILALIKAAHHRRHFGSWKTYYVFQVLRTWNCIIEKSFMLGPSSLLFVTILIGEFSSFCFLEIIFQWCFLAPIFSSFPRWLVSLAANAQGEWRKKTLRVARAFRLSQLFMRYIACCSCREVAASPSAPRCLCLTRTQPRHNEWKWFIWKRST